MQFSITLTHNADILATLRDEWNALQHRSNTPSVFMSWEWMYTWWKHFHHKGELWLLQARNAQGKLVGLAPLMRTRRKIWKITAWHRLEFIGASAHGDHLDFIIERGLENRIIPLFLETLRQHRRQWSVLMLENLPADSPNLYALSHQDIGWEKISDHPCPVICIQTDWQTHFNSLSKNKRKEQRRYLRHLDETFSDSWEWHLVKNPDELTAVLQEMIALHQQKWEEKGHHGGFYDQKLKNFHHEVAHEMLRQNRLRLYRLTIQGQTAAVLYTFQHMGRVFDFASGLNPDFAYYRPGQVLTEISLQNAFEEKYHAYDFLRGDEEYKFRWQAVENHDYTLIWLASRRMQLYRALVATGKNFWQRSKKLLPQETRQRVRTALVQLTEH